MKHATQKHYDELLEQNLISEQLLFAIVATNEPKISKFAYLAKKYDADYEEQEYTYVSNKEKFKEHIEIRNKIVKVLKGRFTQAQIIERAKAINRDDYPAQHIIDDTMALLKLGNYKLVSP